ncbi:MAG: ATP-binding protein [Clostridia bacterium]|nr:ATP-binding protein [Clostridia bacterium]
MKRICEDTINEWIDNSNKALLIYGARQVGKTYIVEDVLNKRNISYVKIDFVENKEILKKISNLDTANEIIDLIELYSNVKLEENKSIIFLDEIQLYPDIITKIKYLVDNGKYRYILSGSNLGIELKNIHSFPDGYVEELKMYPMNFFEFCMALGVQEKTLLHIKECFNKKIKVDDMIHEKMIGLFYNYLMCGGMPDVVKNFVTNKNLRTVNETQQHLLKDYKKDFTKYEDENKRLKIIEIFNSIPSELDKQNRRFIFTELNKELKFDRYEESFLWLKNSATALCVYNVDEPVKPLIRAKSANLFKLFQSDVGLLTSCYSNDTIHKLLEQNKDNEINNGALFENFVCQELVSQDNEVYYYKSKNIGEIDFIIEHHGHLIPIEVKSGKDYKSHKALNNLLNKKEYKINEAIVFSTNNVETVNNITYLPIYMTSLIKKEKLEDTFIDIDIKGL